MVRSRQSLCEQARQILEENQGLAEHEKEALQSLLCLLFDLAEDTFPDDAHLDSYLKQLSANLLASSHLLSIIQALNNELNAIKRLSTNIYSSLDLQTVLDNIVAEAMALIQNVRTAHIFLYDGQQISFGAARFLENTKRDTPFAKPRPNGLTATVARRGEIIIVPDMRHHPLYEDAPASWEGSIVGLPIKYQQRVVGVMTVSRYTTNPFTKQEIHLLTVLCQQASVAISNARLHESVKELANKDTLTCLPNRRALDRQLEQEVQRSNRNGQFFSVVMIDLDGFKAVNDTYGHSIGDEVLAQVAHILQENIRSIDFLARYGGDELTLILPETDAKHGMIAAQKLARILLETDIKVSNGQSVRLGFTGGLAEYPTHAGNASELLRAADAALYTAKRHHRGSVLLADPKNIQI